MDNKTDKKAFIFIGRSGSGKGTQAKLLSDFLKVGGGEGSVLYVQSGYEFRNFVTGVSRTARLSKQINDQGGLQPEFLAVYMWVNMLVREYTGREHLIFDGTPRRPHEAGVLHSIFGFYGIEKPCVIYINVSADWSKQHLLIRGRHDDNEKDIHARLEWFEKEVAPTLQYYKDNPAYSFIEINGEQDIKAVFKDITEKVLQKK
jgi:adenylate kinase family enzyme